MPIFVRRCLVLTAQPPHLSKPLLTLGWLIKIIGLWKKSNQFMPFARKIVLESIFIPTLITYESLHSSSVLELLCIGVWTDTGFKHLDTQFQILSKTHKIKVFLLPQQLWKYIYQYQNSLLSVIQKDPVTVTVFQFFVENWIRLK